MSHPRAEPTPEGSLIVVKGLTCRTPWPRRFPKALPPERVAEILSEPKKPGLGPYMSDLDPTTRQVIRFQKERLGEPLRLDTRKPARIPEGGGDKTLGRSSETKRCRRAPNND